MADIIDFEFYRIYRIILLLRPENIKPQVALPAHGVYAQRKRRKALFKKLRQKLSQQQMKNS